MQEAAEKPEKLPDTKFQQQNLNAWEPLLTPCWVVTFFIVIGVILVPLGVIALAVTNPVVQTDAVRYDNLPMDAANMTTVSIPIIQDMAPPVYFYYQLTDFYQNHRLYVKSRDSNQLKGQVVTASDVDTKCAPLSRDRADKLLYPCGLIAQSIFTDKFFNATIVALGMNDTEVSWTDKGIAWKSDLAKFQAFKNFDSATMSNIDFFTGQPVDHTTEDFMVWMRTSSLPTFAKLRYIIDTPLKAGTHLTVTIQSTFDTSFEGGSKSVLLSTMSGIGGRNPFLGYFGIAMGCLSLVFALGFALLVVVRPRKLGDLGYFGILAERASQ